MVKRAGYVGATKIIEASTGATGAIAVPPLQALVVQVVDATTGSSTGTFDVAGSLDGANWANISTGNTISGNTVLALPSTTGTALPAFTNIQVTVAADPAVSVYVAGR